MIIKQYDLLRHLAKHSISGVYLLIGQDYFLLSDTAETIKQEWKKKAGEVEETIIPINNPSDWAALEEKACSYLLFADQSFLDVRYEKKTLDTQGKHFITHYAKNINSSCFILIRAPHLTLKSIQAITNQSNIYTIPIYPLNEKAMLSWINTQLKKRKVQFENEVPTLILKYTEGNMLASSQIIEKIAMISEPLITIELLKTQLADQCRYQLFELADVCLSKKPNQTIQQLRYAFQVNTEPTLILWILTHEIRQLLQLFAYKRKRIPFSQACKALKIWPQRSPLYQAALECKEESFLLQLLQTCKTIEEQIKLKSGNHVNQVCELLEQLALSLCLGKKVGSFR